jgi:hypothetical protein
LVLVPPASHGSARNVQVQLPIQPPERLQLSLLFTALLYRSYLLP